MSFTHNVIGYLSADSGLAQSARALHNHLSRNGAKVRGTVLSLGDDRTGRVAFPEGPETASSDVDHLEIQWVHVNPPEFDASWGANDPDQIQDPHTFKIAVPYWELEKMPSDWVRSLNAMDAVCAPTPFIADALRESGLTVPILQSPLLFDAPEELVAGNRAKFNLPNGFLFLTHFDLSSDPSRKNPEAAVRAFVKAFGATSTEQDAHLVVVMNNPGKLEGAAAIIDAIREETAGFSNIHWRSGHIPDEDLAEFQASFDAVISLHRAEGLGLVPLEMMVQGKPAVVTGYSGNLAYCTAENSCLVPFEKVPVEVIHPVYLQALEEHPDLTWAEADTDAAAAHMRRLVEDSDWAQLISTQAMESVRKASQVDWLPFIEEVERLAQMTPPATPEQWTTRYGWCSCPWAPGFSQSLPWRVRWGMRWSDYKRKKGWNFAIFKQAQ
jgi:glycosyltransferase involved in cell wall biosynthesis